MSRSVVSRNRIITYAVLGAAVAALTLYVMLRRTDRMQYQLPEVASVEASAIKHITVQTGNEPPVELVRRDDGWVVGDEEYKADARAAESISTRWPN